MLKQLNVSSTACRHSLLRVMASTSASVSTNASMVAMSGSIMPTPLATPTTRAGPARCTAVLGTVSVVIMARATSTASASNAGVAQAGQVSP